MLSESKDEGRRMKDEKPELRGQKVEVGDQK
jgi:hypothetical protein